MLVLQCDSWTPPVLGETNLASELAFSFHLDALVAVDHHILVALCGKQSMFYSSKLEISTGYWYSILGIGTLKVFMITLFP